MRKKILALLMGIAVMAIGGATLAACAPESEGGTTNQFEAIYSIYCENTTGKGETPLTYEEWLASITGPQGDKGDTGAAGASAYDTWLSVGNSGTEADFIAWLKGEAGIDGADIADISVELVEIRGIVGTNIVYRITLTDGTVISKMISSSRGDAQETDIANISINGTIYKQSAGDPLPDLLCIVSYKSASTKYVQLSDMELVITPDFTEAGHDYFIVNYEGSYHAIHINIIDMNDTTPSQVASVNGQILWFSQDSIAENVDGVSLYLYAKNNSTTVITAEASMFNLTFNSSATGSQMVEVTINDIEYLLQVYVVNSTRQAYLASNSYTAIFNSTSDGIFIGEEALGRSRDYIRITTSLDRFTYYIIKPFTTDDIVTVSGGQPFSNTVAGSYEYTLSAEKLASIGITSLTNTLTITVLDENDAATKRTVGLGGRATYPVQSTNILPEIYFSVITTNSTYSYRDEAVFLTDEMIVNRSEIDFSVPGRKDIQIEYLDITYTEPISIQIVDTNVCNIEDVYVYYMSASAYVFEYNIGTKTEAAARSEIYNNYTGLIFHISYLSPVYGQYTAEKLVTQNMLNFSRVDFTKVGVYPVYVEYGEGANKATYVVTYITISDPNASSAGQVMYNCTNNTNLYLNADSSARITQYGFVCEQGTYTRTGDEIVFTSGNGTLYFTVTGADTVIPKVINDTPNTTYESIVQYGFTVQVCIYDNYVTVSMTYSGVLTGLFTMSTSLLKDNMIFVAQDIYILNSDGTVYFVPRMT